MSKIQPEQSAFPYDNPREFSRGMSLRDHFAGQALNGLMSQDGSISQRPEVVAQMAYKLADAMMEERSKKK